MDSAAWDAASDSIFNFSPSSVASQLPESPEQNNTFPETVGLSKYSEFYSPPPHFVTPPLCELEVPPVPEGLSREPARANNATHFAVSTTFLPASNLLPNPPDFVMISADEVSFYVHTTQVLGVSSNHFNNTVSCRPVCQQGLHNEPGFSDQLATAHVAETSHVLNVLLHAIYGLSCAAYQPPLDVLLAAVDAMPTYGLSPQTHVTPSSPLFALILAQAPINPLLAYACAARHDLAALATPISAHLLAFPPDALTDELAACIAPAYLRRLLLLHAERVETLKALLCAPPHPHPPTARCDFEAQKALTRAWTLAAGSLVWEARADVSDGVIQRTLSSLSDYISCVECKRSLADRVKQVLARWTLVKVHDLSTSSVGVADLGVFCGQRTI
ncbi:hypothetical protein BD413DRAFT_611779 [Trametes elegans]|nr:hypothetical protein BD413DRAFT_611779 [Trametes elegans]